MTTEKELSQWWNRGVKLEPKLGGEFYEPWGKDQLATGKVLRVNPGALISFTWKEKTWQPHQKTICTIRLKKDNKQTILEVEHGGWEAFPESERKAMVQGFQKGWDFFLNRLMSHLDRGV